jgi:hypothetical protein
MLDEKELEKRRQELMKLPGVLDVKIAHKFIDGVDTGKDAIVVYVEKKKPLNELKKVERIPTCLADVPTDVVELSSPDFKVGKTSVSTASLEEQRRKANGLIRKK